MKEYIEKDAALEATYAPFTMSMRMTVPECNGMNRARKMIFKQLRAIPAADVRPVVKARWIHMPSDGKFRDTCVCSACKKSPPIESWIVQEFNACPYCFADMREEN